MSKYFFGLKVFHLFDLNAIKIQRVPSLDDPDNARYLLYECKGGYPIGVFSMYARVTANVAYRFKKYCEYKFDKLVNGK